MFCALLSFAVVLSLAFSPSAAGVEPQVFSRAAVVSQNEIASQAGADILRPGGNAVNAAVATAFALAVTRPAAGDIGGGGFLVFRSASGESAACDFRETAPAVAPAQNFCGTAMRRALELFANSACANGCPHPRIETVTDSHGDLLASMGDSPAQAKRKIEKLLAPLRTQTPAVQEATT